MPHSRVDVVPVRVGPQVWLWVVGTVEHGIDVVEDLIPLGRTAGQHGPVVDTIQWFATIRIGTSRVE